MPLPLFTRPLMHLPLKNGTLWLCLLLLLLTQHAAYGALEARDAEDRLVTLERPATRVIALAPHIVENLFSIDAQDTLVGAVHYSDYPDAAGLIPRVGGIGSMSLERIVALEPDLIVLWGSGTPIGLRSSIERLGLSYFVDEIRSLADLGDSFEALGVLTGHQSEGARVSAQLHSSLNTLDSVQARRRSGNIPGVFFQLWDQPLQSIGKDHLLSEVIERCGGRSITNNIAGLAPLVSLERVLSDNPALIIVENQQQARHWDSYPELKAMRTANVAVINPDLLHRPTLRLLQGMQIICKGIDAISQAANAN
ncbi:MAG: iron complex transport system substrate-binding protein [Glaciecola sp.]|jgi:iron complex transport system substrate-binding protein